MAVRKQIVVPDDVDRRIRRLAIESGRSQSAVVAEAIRAMPEPAPQAERVLAWAGVIAEGPAGTEGLSEQVDEVVYGAR